jgi:small subunit ribosomal protein S24e
MWCTAAVQNGLMEAPANKSRKQIKERKNRTKKLRGAKKNATVAAAKK